VTLPPLPNALDPYDGLGVYAERPMTHPVDDEVCRFVGPHPRALCRYVHPPSAAHPIVAGELTEMPAVLTRPKPLAPWETT
jgi:hypothetical protein